MTANEVGRQCWHAIDLVLRPSVFDRDVLAFDIAGFLQTLTERGRHGPIPVGRGAVEKPNHRHRCLLRTRGHRPRRGRAAEQRDELAAGAHSMTSSARASSDGGTLRPRARAVGRLIANTNLADCTTGKSAGFSPLMIRPA